jgi:hypothetical protein
MTQEQIKALKPGARVKLSAYGGEILERRVVRVSEVKRNEFRAVITSEEWWQQYGEDAEGLAWPPEDVLEEVKP